MRNYNLVCKDSNQEVLQQKAAILETQKVAVINALKEMYMITGKISSLPYELQEEMKTRVLEYWSPKTGLTKAGVRLLNEQEIVINKKSSKDDLRLYIEKQVKKHYQTILESYRNQNVTAVVDAFKEDLLLKTGRNINENFINNTVWKLLEDRFKLGIDY